MLSRLQTLELCALAIALASLACGQKTVESTETPRHDTKREQAAGTIVTEPATVAASVIVDAAPVADAAPAVRAGCDGATLLAAPDTPSARGPWPVGTRSITVAGLATEVWYPASPGSEAGASPVVYDLREHLPESQRSKVPDDAGMSLACDCYRDLPVDGARGPYPVVVFVHGYTLFRTQSTSMMSHWASRGFIVLSSDYPGITLDAVMSRRKARFPMPFIKKVHAAIRELSGDLAFLSGAADTERLALAGHSMGGEAVGKLGGLEAVEVVIAMAEDGTVEADRSFMSFVIGGTADAIEPIDRQDKGYRTSPVPKRMLAIEGAGHMAFSDLCAIGDDGATRLALDHGVTMKGFVAKLARTGCSDGTLPLDDGWEIIHYATTAALEEKMMCSATATESLSRIQASFPAATREYRESL